MGLRGVPRTGIRLIALACAAGMALAAAAAGSASAHGGHSARSAHRRSRHFSAPGRSAHGRSASNTFTVTGGTVSIQFTPAVVAAFAQLGVRFDLAAPTVIAPASAAFPTLAIAPSTRSQPQVINTATMSGGFHIYTDGGFYAPSGSSFITSEVFGDSYVNLGAHSVLEGRPDYTSPAGGAVERNVFVPVFELGSSSLRPVVRSGSITFAGIPISLAAGELQLFNLFGPGFSAGEPFGTITIHATGR